MGSRNQVRIYDVAPANLPRPELYVIYTKERGDRPETISLRFYYKNGTDSQYTSGVYGDAHFRSYTSWSVWNYWYEGLAVFRIDLRRVRELGGVGHAKWAALIFRSVSPTPYSSLKNNHPNPSPIGNGFG